MNEHVELNLYDTEELYTDCTVQILRNSITGDESVGWWRNGNPPPVIKWKED